MRDIFPIARSLTGKGVADTFEILNGFLRENGCPELIVESRYADTLADKVLSNVLDFDVSYTRYSFLYRRSDERQYNAPGVDMPVVGFCRSKYVTYKYYHTSKDDMSFVSPAGFEGSFMIPEVGDHV